MITRNMRMINPINALFSKTRQEILVATYSQPEKWWFMSELASFIKTTSSSLQRELGSLVESGILRSRRDGNRVYFQAESESPIFAPLREIIFQTLGLPKKLKDSLRIFDEKIVCAFIYGSVARGEEHSQSDVDVILIGAIGLADVSPTFVELERKFQREINPICFSVEEFRKKLKLNNHFLTNVLSGEKIFLVGGDDELEQLSER
jgi:uncharacterized protein